MTPSELKRIYYQRRPDGHFFDRDTMKFFGDTMKNFGVIDRNTHWFLYRKDWRPTANISHFKGWFFDKETMDINYTVKTEG